MTKLGDDLPILTLDALPSYRGLVASKMVNVKPFDLCERRCFLSRRQATQRKKIVRVRGDK